MRFGVTVVVIFVVAAGRVGTVFLVAVELADVEL